MVAAVTWGTTGATMKLVGRHSPMSPLLIGFFRVAFAAPALVVAARILVRPRPHPAPGDRLRLLAGGLAMGAYQACYFWAVAKTSVAVGSLVAMGANARRLARPGAARRAAEVLEEISQTGRSALLDS